VTREPNGTEPASPVPAGALTTSTVAAALVAAFCALLLAKWLALAALVALAIFLGLRRLVVGVRRNRRGPADEDDQTDVAGDLPGEDCTWCGLAGGHHDSLGRPVRPRHAHGASRAA
jgi:hypothetical protein